MTPIFLGALLLGLVLGVAAMLNGVVRYPATLAAQLDPVPQGLRSARLAMPLIAAFATVSGATGYLIDRNSELSAAATLLVAVAVGALGVVGALALVAKWAIPGARPEVEDERFLLMGHPARVFGTIDDGGLGTISYEMDGEHHTIPARTLGGDLALEGTEVIIERVEQGVAHVELWTVVEQRL